MKKNLFLLSSVLLISCASLDTVECLDCAKAPTTLLIPNAHNTIQLNSTQEKELNTMLEDNVVIVPVVNKNQLVEPKKTQTQIKNGNENSVSKLLDSVSIKAKAKWGEDNYQQPSKHHYVKYLDDYTTKTYIQFDLGKITVSSIADDGRKQKIRDAIVQTLLMPQSPEKIDLFGTKKIAVENRKDSLLFLGQILDLDEKPIEWEWRANRFADYLVANKLQEKKTANGIIDFVEIELVSNHIELREQLYSQTIQTIAKQYDLQKDLISAIIKTESSFNPFAVTYGGALGLMQIVPTTAGADVFKLVKKRDPLPSIDYFLEPYNNIDTGTAYLNILYNRYLHDLTNPVSKYMAMITAYNSGAGGVLSTFNADKKTAIEIINQNDPKQVYHLLITQHPRKEARTYLQRVMSLQKNVNLEDA